jgi:NhaA family Na+:H+ antiporter
MRGMLKRFMATESSSGILLLIVTALALVAENSALREAYHHFLHLPLGISAGSFTLQKGLSHWINDGLMVIFFFLVGMEIKREILQGHLSTREQLLLPLIAAVGGMVVPAFIFFLFDHTSDYALKGWAIPSATDIAFAIGVLSLLGKRVPTSLKVFLTALAVIDDMGAVLIIALFYSEGISLPLLLGAAAVLVALYFLNKRGVRALIPYLLLGVVLWLFTLGSGIHATIAGVLLALTIPLRTPASAGTPPLLKLEHAIHPYVAFGIMPLFAFANAGLPLEGLSFARLLEPVPAGIAAGLFFGKQIGVYLSALCAIKLKLGKMPAGATWAQLYGVSILAGIGFTMSLFIGSLAYKEESYLIATRLGVLSGSLLSAVFGLLVLRLVSRSK